MSMTDNLRRVWEAGRCRKGHPLTPRPDGKRQCETCKSAYMRDYWTRRATP